MAEPLLTVVPDANPFARCGINGYVEAKTVTEQIACLHAFHGEDCEKALALPTGFLKPTVVQAVRLRLAYLKQRGLA